MKKIFFIVITALAFIACEGPEGPRGPAGPGTNWEVQFITINENQWERFQGQEENEVFYRAVIVPQLFTEISRDDRIYIYDEGTILSYILFNYNTPEETQTLLPYIYNYSNQNNQSAVETVYFDYNIEDVAFYVSYSGTDENYRPGTMTFRIVMNW